METAQIQRAHRSAAPGAEEIVHELDNFDVPAFTQIAARFGQERYGYVVTPNVDHMIRYYEEPQLRELYHAADYVLLDSRFAARLLRLVQGVRLQVCTGADLTAALLSGIIAPDDRIILIGGSAAEAHRIAADHGLKDLHHHNPPMGFIKDAQAIEECLQFIERHSPFRFCFLAVGCPQQEMLARYLKERGRARGLALCVGAALNFLTGAERRAPLWVQRAGLEWLYRLVRSPRRLAGRYLLRGPRFFLHLRRTRVVARTATA